MFSEQCFAALDIRTRSDTGNSIDAFVQDFSNFTDDVSFADVVLQPDPNPPLLSWFSAYYLLHNVALLDSVLFLLTIFVPRKMSLQPHLISFPTFRSALACIEKIEFFFKELLKALIGVFLIIVCLPIVVTSVVIFGTAVRIIEKRLESRYGKTASKAAALDSIWGSETPKSRPFITVFMILTGKPSINKIRALIQSRVLDRKESNGCPTYRKFRQLLTIEYGYFIWKDAPKFDIRKHIYVWNDPRKFTKDVNSDKQMNEEQKCRAAEAVALHYINYYGCQKMNENRPKWEIVLLHSNASPDGKYSVVVRLHHSIADGVSLMRLVTESLVDESERALLSTTLRPRQKVGALDVMWSACMMPQELLKALCNFDKNPLYGRPLTGTKMYFMSRPVSLDAVRQVRMAASCTVNDVLMSCVSAAFSRTFHGRCGSTVTLVVPICYHDVDESNPLVNKIIMANLKLPLPKPDTSPCQRLHLVKMACNAMKSAPGLLAGYHTTTALCALLPALLARKILTLPGITMGASNVPGPQQSVRLWGDRVESLGFWVPDRDPTGAGLGLLSYAGGVRLFLSADVGLAATAPEMEQFTAQFESELASLQSSTASEHRP
ncbi:putative diacyglycerol O-acyltransferase MT3848 isoform X2 [Hyalella azteca]|uniref:Diacyglycerol O-acyltransferase MT3848 isoform X2 n=1 Tax=Hyalella azteca TaxID=294128 RepID=A0A8B7PB93_HYAAZ|nr:putative diacyglycerol O-acyltransferase MT3848 isoform X2 [Hyalella azteca]